MAKVHPERRRILEAAFRALNNAPDGYAYPLPALDLFPKETRALHHAFRVGMVRANGEKLLTWGFRIHERIDGRKVIVRQAKLALRTENRAKANSSRRGRNWDRPLEELCREYPPQVLLS